MYWNPASPPIDAVSIEILNQQELKIWDFLFLSLINLCENDITEI